MKFPYSIKNWKVANEYPSPAKMKGVALAWEFLRRNPEYQADFDRLPKIKKEYNLRNVQPTLSSCSSVKNCKLKKIGKSK